MKEKEGTLSITMYQMKFIDMVKSAVLMAAFLLLIFFVNDLSFKKPQVMSAALSKQGFMTLPNFYPSREEFYSQKDGGSLNSPVNVVAKEEETSKMKYLSEIKNNADYLLNIPKIGVSASVFPMGIDKDGKMAVPDNYVDVGWYSLGAKPGAKGNAVLGAHVDNGGNVSGVFKNLKSLSVGDSVTLEDTNGNKLVYRITRRDIFPYDIRDTSSVFARTGKSQLKLITCHGNFIESENTYDKRLVITAELV